jgi:RNA polymerase sigma-70 factor, ECF subfamily
MGDTTRDDLRRTLVARYDELAKRLKRDIGSEDLAEDALQDAWLRLHQSGATGPVRNLKAYVVRVAFNIARDKIRLETRRAPAASIEEMLGLSDDVPGPAEIAEGRSEMRALRAALDAMPARRRQIFEAAWGEGLPHSEIAKRFGLTVRSINLELAQARELCAEHLKRNAVRDFPQPIVEASDE